MTALESECAPLHDRNSSRPLPALGASYMGLSALWPRWVAWRPVPPARNLTGTEVAHQRGVESVRLVLPRVVRRVEAEPPHERAALVTLPLYQQRLHLVADVVAERAHLGALYRRG